MHTRTLTRVHACAHTHTIMLKIELLPCIEYLKIYYNSLFSGNGKGGESIYGGYFKGKA